MRTFHCLAAAGVLLLGALPLNAQRPARTAARPAARPVPAPVPATLDSALTAAMQWRNLGPDRGGRSIAVSGVRGRPLEAYFGATGGGLWKTADGGETWSAVTDGKIGSASVGAVAVAESNPDIVFIGTGETCIRGNIMPGDGVYRSRDGGKSWTKVGFEESHGISKIRIHPGNPDIVFVAAFGKYSAPNGQRGVFKSTDGGDTWRRVLFRNDSTAAIDLVFDRTNPNVMYAALWEAYRKEYVMSSGGPGSGLFKSTDGGETWTEITRNPGLPATGIVGRIGVAVSGADPNRVWALVEHAQGGLFRSDDAGASWTLVNDDRRIRQRAFYYTHVFADPRERDVVYLQNTSFFRSTDGGKTLADVGSGTHGDFHDLWIDPDDPKHLVVGNDGGGSVSTTTGAKWTAQDFPTPQFYHAVTTKHVPFHVCGSQQDNTTLCVPSDWNAARAGVGGGRRRIAGLGGAEPADLASGAMAFSYEVGGGEPGYIAPDPRNIDLFYSGTNNGRYLDRFDRRTGLSREVNPYPWFYSGEPSSEIRERWQWTYPIVFSPIDATRLYVSSQRLWISRDGGNSWTAISGDLTRHDPATLGKSGGPITGDMNGPEVYATIFAVAPSKVDVNVIWTGSDDGLVHVTRDGGKTWTNVTPPDMPDFGRVSQIDASAFSAGIAYVSVRRPLLDDFAPYIWKTADFGKTWTRIVTGIREDAYVHAVREDPARRGLLFAATQHGVYASYDDGARWQPLSLNLPDVPVVDVIVERDELVIGTHGRGFWVLDNAAPLRQWTPAVASAATHLFTPARAIRGSPGITLSWWNQRIPSTARLEILDSAGTVLRTWRPDTTPRDTSATARRGREAAALPMAAGVNRLHWDLRGEPFERFPGMILWGVRATAPALPPGRYVVRYEADGVARTAPLVIEPHPHVPGVTAADLRAQYAFSRAVRDKVTEANRAVVAIRRVKAQVAERLDRSNDVTLKTAGDRLVGAAAAIEESIYQVRNRSNQDPLNFPIKVNNRLATLLSMAEAGDGRPNAGMREIFETLSAELKGYTDRLEVVWKSELAAFNAEAQRLGMPRADPACATAAGCVTP
jgi:photosystem II stability/assembly factor-like uncharacterized protein